MTTSDPSKQDILDFMRGTKPEFMCWEERCPDWCCCRMDMEIAIYWLAHDYHVGDWSKLYGVMLDSEYKPEDLESGIEIDAMPTAWALYELGVEYLTGEVG